MRLFLLKTVGEHLHSLSTIPSFNSLSLEGSAHPTSPKYNIFYGNTWADIKRILKSFVKSSILSSPSLFVQPRVTEVDSSNKNIKPFFCEMILLLFICRKIHDVFYFAFHSLLSTFSSSIIHIGQLIKSTVKSTMIVAGGS